MTTGVRVGVDIGGTFTDIVFLGADGVVHTKKISSSADDYARSIAEGLRQLFAETHLSGPDVLEFRHGTTVGSNAILERNGAKLALITTKGFRDVLEIGTLRIPRLYDLKWEKLRPLVRRRFRFVVDERIDAQGRVQKALAPADAEQIVNSVLSSGVDAVAVCLINSFANPIHELAIKEIIRRRAPDMPVSISYEVFPEIKEYERTSTTVINTYILPVVARYLGLLRRALDNERIGSPILLMQSNGGLTTDAVAARLPMNIIESGPAGGVVGAQALARAIGLSDIVTFDMGGTTAKASIVENGEVTRANEYQVGGGIIKGSRLLSGAGYMLMVPAIDLAEVGAGGGSIIWIDAGGSMQIGPQSAGASPGPACYDAGGEEPTITDANVVLGYLNPEYLVSGAVKLNAAKSHDILRKRIAGPLNLSLEYAAYGAHQIAASNMIRAIKAVSTERGRDVRKFALFAFGGNGPIFASSMARTLRMERVIIPPSPGVFSSFGLLYADVAHHYSRTFRRLLRQSNLEELNAAFERTETQASQQLAAEGFTGARALIRRAVSMHYKGQTFELTIPLNKGRLQESDIASLEKAFGQEHERTYGHRASADEPVELVSIQVVGHGILDRPAVPEKLRSGRNAVPKRPAPRRAYFGPELGWLDTPVLFRADLNAVRQGPCIIEEYDATCVVPPGATALLDDYGNIVIKV